MILFAQLKKMLYLCSRKKNTAMKYKYFAKFCAVLMAVMLCVSCERKSSVEDDPRTPFVGDYTFVSDGSIEFNLPIPLPKIPTDLPIHETGEMSIALADKDNAIWVIADKDTSLAYVSGNKFFMEPSTQKEVFGGVVEMVLDYTYSGAELKDNKFTLTSYVDVTATYQEIKVTGKGEVEVVATKKD